MVPFGNLNKWFECYRCIQIKPSKGALQKQTLYVISIHLLCGRLYLTFRISSGLISIKNCLDRTAGQSTGLHLLKGVYAKSMYRHNPCEPRMNVVAFTNDVFLVSR